jgi:predicted translin family RNA/ssDNA-binding protein
MIEEDERREVLIKKSREVLKASKGAIYNLHRRDVAKAREQLAGAVAIMKGELLPLVAAYPSLRFSLSGALEEYAEAVVFSEYLASGRIITMAELECEFPQPEIRGKGRCPPPPAVLHMIAELATFSVVHSQTRTDAMGSTRRQPTNGNPRSQLLPSTCFHLHPLVSLALPCLAAPPARAVCSREEYLGGVMDFVGELNRYAVLRATERDFTAVKHARDTVDQLLAAFMQFDWRNGNLRRKYDAVRAAAAVAVSCEGNVATGACEGNRSPVVQTRCACVRRWTREVGRRAG